MSQLSTGLSDEEKHSGGTASAQRHDDDDAVMSFKAWCRRNDISPATVSLGQSSSAQWPA